MSSYGVEAMRIYEGEFLDKMVRDRPVATKPSSLMQVISRSLILAVPDGTKPVGDMGYDTKGAWVRASSWVWSTLQDAMIGNRRSGK